MSERITWTSSGRATWSGAIGDLDLFTISWKTSARTKDWVLSGRLASLREDLGSYDTADEAKAAGEAALVTFVEKLGARF